MRLEDISKLATGNILFNLNRIIAPRLVTLFYLLGLAAIMLWAVTHFFSTFRFGFGSGLWGLLEIAVFGLLALIVLRIACEAVIVYFRAHAAQADDYAPAKVNASLIDDVREAIEDLAEEEAEAEETYRPTPPTPAPPAPAPSASKPAPYPAPAASSTSGPATPPAPGPGSAVTEPSPSISTEPVAEEPAIMPGTDTPKPAPKRRGRPPKPKPKPETGI